MFTLILPGNSKNNEQYAKDLEFEFQGHNLNPIMILYNHWQTGEELLDYDFELTKLYEILSKRQNESYKVFAKSAGIILFLKFFESYHTIEHPTLSVFAGIPLRFAEAIEYPLVCQLQSLTSRVIILQKALDPQIGFTALKEKLPESDILKLINIPGNNHNYSDLNSISYLLQT